MPISWLAPCLLLLWTPLFAEPDDTQQAWLERVDARSHWDNVAAAPQWIGGVEPTRRLGESLHKVSLSPGESITVRVPAGERVRIHQPSGPLNAADFEITWSNGSGLFASLVPQISADPAALLADPPVGREALLRVRRQHALEGSVELALFISRNPNRLIATSYRERLTPLPPASKVAVDDGSRAYAYWRSDRTNPLRVELEGAQRIELDSRLLFPDRDGSFGESYRISVSLNGAPWRILDLASVLDTTAPVAVDGCYRPIGRPAYGYLDLPGGSNRLELRVQRPMLIRLLARQQPDDYLYQGNRPTDYADSVGSSGSEGAGAHFWRRTEAELALLRSSLSRPDSSTYLDAVRIAQHNGHRLGGVSAMQPLAAWAARYPAQSRYRTLADWRRLLHTFYRDLLPQRPSGVGESVFAWFPTAQLADKTDSVFVAENYAQSLANNLASGFFTEIPTTEEKAQEYLIPEQFQPQTLRVAVARSGLSAATSFYLQIDDTTPVLLWMEGDRQLPADEFRAGTGTAALGILQSRHGTATATLSGAFASRRPAAPLADVAFLELPIQQPVRSVKVWREDSDSGPPRLALAYRSSSWYQMSEAGYLALLQSAESAAVERLFQSALSDYTQPSDRSNGRRYPLQEVASSVEIDRKRDLYNQWLPLLRLLHARFAAFSASVEAQAAQSDSGQKPDEQKIGEVVQQAEAAERDGDWLAALQKWSWLQRSASRSLQLRARHRQVRALRQLGNSFLAKQLLRHDFLFAKQLAGKEQALEQLLELALAEDDAEGLLTLRAVAAFQHPGPVQLRELAAALSATGRSRFAVQVLLALPERQRSMDTLLECAYDLGWWRLFEQTLSSAGDAELKALWLGRLAQLDGNYQAALDHWQQSGQAGRQLSAHLTAGLRVRDGLDSPDAGVRHQSLIAWERWQREAPGAKVWRAIPQSVVGHDGSRTVLSIAQGNFSNLFQATPDKPVRVSVYGPLTLRFEARPLHDSFDEQPLDDWVIISSDGGDSRYPVIDNRPSKDLRLAPDADQQVGRKLEIEYQVPPGYHEFELTGMRHKLLLGVYASQPRFPLSLLPPLTPYTARSALADSVFIRGLLAAPDDNEAVQIEVLKQCADKTTISMVPLMGMQHGVANKAVLGSPSAAWFRDLEAYRSSLMPQPKELTGALQGDDYRNHAPTLKERLIGLLWEAEQAPEQHQAILIQAEDLAQTTPNEPGVEPILRRLRRHASWQLIRSVQQSAGMRLIEFTGWQPETPEMRARKAVMALHTNDAQVLSGYDTRVLAMYNLRPVEVTLDLGMVETAYQPSQKMRVLVAWDDKPETAVLLNADTPEVSLTEKVGAGNHMLRLRIARPLVNQLLRVRINERRRRGSLVIAEPLQRSYMLATRQQPLVLMLQGPARLRIDEWRDGQTLTAYRTLESGWQRVVIAVEQTREEALLRVFRRTLEPDKPMPAMRTTAYAAESVAESFWALDKAIQIPESKPSQPLPVSMFDQGTWSLIGGLTSRRTVDDEPQQSAGEEKFADLGGSFRYFSEHQDTYYHADSRVRLHDEGDPTLAFRGSMNFRKRHWPFDLDTSGSLFLQHLDSTGQIESAGTLRARISRELYLGEKTSHRPSLSVFQRWLSLARLPGDDAEKVDQDIFTEYKHDHKRGLRIGERIQHRPWLDSVVYAGAYLASNEDLDISDPDHLGLNVGARQLIGDAGLGVRYSHFQYFDDGDRDKDSNTQRLRLDFDFSRWLTSRRGLQASVRYEYDRDSADSSVFLSLSLNRSNGRYYRDYRPGDLDFRHLRQRRALERQVGAGKE